MSPAPIDNREERVLTAAAELFTRFGYDKTTIDDVAREAGLSKGSVYLAFDSKQRLFEGVLLTQMRAFSTKWLEAVEAHPRGGTLGAMYEAMLRAIDVSPFMSMIYRRDPSLLGRYIQQPDNFFRDYAAGQPTRHEVIAEMQAVGAVRDDVDAKVVAHIINMIAMSMVSANDMVPAADIPSTDDLLSGIATFMDRAFTPEGGGDSEAGKAVIRRIFAGVQPCLISSSTRAAPRRKQSPSDRSTRPYVHLPGRHRAHSPRSLLCHRGPGDLWLPGTLRRREIHDTKDPHRPAVRLWGPSQGAGS